MPDLTPYKLSLVLNSEDSAPLSVAFVPFFKGDPGRPGLTKWTSGETYMDGDFVIAKMPVEYQGLVATHALVPFYKFDFNQEMNSVSRHTATEDITDMTLLNPNFTGFGEAVGAAATIRQTVEYPIGSGRQRVMFNGSDTGTIPDGGALAGAITLTTPIPRGADFLVRTWFVNPAGIVCAQIANCNGINLGEAIEAGPTGSKTDKTGAGVVGNEYTTNLYTPMAIIGKTTRPSVFVLGDSIAGGHGNSTGLAGTVDNGSVAPSLSRDLVAHSLLSAFGKEAREFVSAGTTIPDLLGPYITHVVCEMGINDIMVDFPAASVLAAVQGCRTKMGKPFFACTLTPEQVFGLNASRIAYNAAIRAGASGMAGYFEVADVVETARDSGVWKPGYTPDNLHGNGTAYAAIRGSGAIDSTRFTLKQGYAIYAFDGDPIVSTIEPSGDADHWVKVIGSQS